MIDRDNVLLCGMMEFSVRVLYAELVLCGGLAAYNRLRISVTLCFSFCYFPYERKTRNNAYEQLTKGEDIQFVQRYKKLFVFSDQTYGPAFKLKIPFERTEGIISY